MTFLFPLILKWILINMLVPMIGENRQLVTDEPVEFEEKPVEVQDCKKITHHYRGIYRINPNLIKETGGCQHVAGGTCKH